MKLKIDLTSKVTSVDEAKEKIKQLRQEIEKVEKKIDISVSPKELEEGKKQLEALKRTVTEVEKSGGDFSKTYKKNFEAVAKETSKTDKEMRKVSKSAKEMSNASNKGFTTLSNTAKIATYDIRQTESQIDSLKNNLQQGVGQTLAFGAINGIQNVITESVERVKQLDTILTDISIVSGKTTEEMAVYRDYAGEAANSLGTLGSEYLKASLIYEQQGGMAAQFAKDLGQSTVVAANISRESTEAMSEYLTATINGFQMLQDKGGEAGTYITDVLAKLGAASGSDLGEIATGLTRTANIARDVGYEFEEISTMIATVSEVTRRTPETIGNAFKTMLTSFSQLREAGEEEVNAFTNKIEKAFQLGGIEQISVFDNGNLRDASDIFKDIAANWTTMNKEQQALVSEAVAGKYQAEVFQAFMQNQERYNDLLEDAYAAEGTAAQQQLVYMDSLEAKVDQYKNAWERASSSLMNSDIYSTLLEQGTRFLNLIGDQENAFVSLSTAIAPIAATLGATFGSKFMGDFAQGKALKEVSDFSDKQLENLAKEKGWNDEILANKKAQNVEAKKQQEIIQYLGKDAGGAYKKMVTELESLTAQLDLVVDKEETVAKLTDKYMQGSKNPVGYDPGEISKRINEDPKFIESSNNLEMKKTELEIAKQYNTEMKTLTTSKENIVTKENQINKNYLAQRKSLDTQLEKLQTLIYQEELRDGATKQTQEDMLLINDTIEKTTSLEKRGTISKKQANKLTKELKEEQSQLNELIERQNAKSQSMVQSRQKELNIAKQINEEERKNATKRTFSAMTDEKLEGKSKEQIQSEIDYTQNMKNKTEEASKSTKQWEKGTKGVMMAMGAIVPIATAINSQMKGTAETSDTILTVIQTLSTSVMFTMGPWGMVIGALGMIGSMLLDHSGILENTYEKAKKENTETIKQFLSLQESSGDMLSNMKELKDVYKEFEGVSAPEVLLNNPEVDEQTKKDYKDMSEKIAKARPDLVKYYNEENVAIVDLSQSYEELLKVQQVEAVQAQGMLEKNRASFLVEYGHTLEDASSKTKELNIETAKFKKEMDSARSSGNSKNLTEAISGFSKAKTDLETLRKEVEDTKAAINANIVSPFINANEAMEKFADNDGISNILKQASSSLITTDTVTSMVEKGQEERLEKFMKNLEIMLLEVGKLESASEGAGQELFDKFTSQSELAKQLIKDQSFETTDEMFKAMESAQEKHKREMSKNVISGIDASNEQAKNSQEIDRLIEKEKELYEIRDKSKNSSDASSLYISSLVEIEKIEKEINKLTESTSKQNINLKETRVLYEEISQTAKGFAESMSDVDSLQESKNIIQSISTELQKNPKLDLGSVELEAQFNNLDSIMPDLGAKMKQQFEDGKTDISDILKSIDEEQDAMVMGMMANDTQYFNHWKEWNKEKYDIIAAAGNDEIANATTLKEYETALNKMSFEELVLLRDAQIQASKDVSEAEKIKAQGQIDINTLLADDTLSWNQKLELRWLDLVDTFGNAFHGVISSIQDGLVELYNMAVKTINKVKSADKQIKEKEKPSKNKKPRKSKAQAQYDLYKKDQKEKEENRQNIIEELLGDSSNDEKEYRKLLEDRQNALNKKFDTSGLHKDKGRSEDPFEKEDKEKKKKKEVQDIKLVLNEYYKLENQLKRVNDAYSRVNKSKSQVYGADKLRAMDKEQQLLMQQAGVNEDYIKALKREQSSLQSTLTGKGFRFDATGEITNLNDKLREMERQANSLTGEAKEKAIEKVKAMQEEASRYSDITFNMIPNKEQAIIDAKATFAAIAKEKFEYKIQLKVDKDDLKNQAIETVKEMQDTWSKYDEKTNLTGSQMKMWMGQIDMFEKELKRLQNDAQGMNDNDRNEKIRELQKNILDATGKARASYKELIEIQKQFVDESINAINKISERYQNILDKAELLITKQRELYGYSAMKETQQLFDLQQKSIDQNIDSLIGAQKWLIKYRDTLDKNTASWDNANEKVNELGKTIDAQLVKKMDIIKEKFEALTDDLFKKFDKGFGIFGLQGAQDEFDNLIKKRDEFFSGYEKYSTIGSKIAEINREIANTNDPERTRQLSDFRDKELQALMKQDKVSKDEYERAMKLYEIKLKELAIEERRDAKRVAQLVRDSQGNMGYEYIREETEDVSKDLAELQKAKEDLYEFDSQKVKDASKEIFTVIANYQGKLKELQSMNLSPEEYKKEAQKLLDAAEEAIKESQEKIKKWTTLMAKDGMDNMNEMVKSGALDLDKLGVNKEIFKQVSQSLNNGSLSMEQMMSGDISNFANKIGVSEEEAKDSIKKMLDFMMSENQELANMLQLSVQHWTNSAQENITQLSQAYDQYIKQSTTVLSQYNAVTGDLNKLLQDTTKESKKTQAQIEQQTKAMIATTKANEGTSRSVKQLEERLVGKNGKGGLFGSMVQLVKHMGNELRPSMVKTGKETDVLARKTKNAGDKYGYMYTQSRKAYNQTREYNQKNLSHSYAQFDTISRKTRDIGDRFTTMGRNADSARSKTVNLASELARLPGWDAYGKASAASGGGSKTKGFATGGYTGEWKNSQSNREGKLAVLHQKELVLNEKDTANMLKAVSLTREIALGLTSRRQINQETINNVNNSSSDISNSNNKEIKQDIKIENNFTGETTPKAITDAMNSILSDVSTYIGRP